MRQPVRNLAATLGALAVVAATVLLTLEPTPAAAAAKEYQVKAAYLYNFAKFIEWPDSAFPSGTAPIHICVLGEDRFDGVLEKAVEGKSVKGRPVSVSIHAPGSAPPARCNILFISSSEAGRESEIISAVSGNAVVTVGEVDGFAARGGMLNFAIAGSKIKVELNINAADKASLKVSSKLQQIATAVGG